MNNIKLSNKDFLKIISDAQNILENHKLKYPEYVKKFNEQLQILKNEFENQTSDKDNIENVYNEIEFILNDFIEEHVPPIGNPAYIRPFTNIENILPVIRQYF